MDEVRHINSLLREDLEDLDDHRNVISELIEGVCDGQHERLHTRGHLRGDCTLRIQGQEHHEVFRVD